MSTRFALVFTCLWFPLAVKGFTYRTKDVLFTTDELTHNTTWLDNLIGVSKGKCGCRRSLGWMGDSCQCCIKVYIKSLPKMEACAEFQYDSSAKALDFTITINREQVVEKRISVTTDTKFCHDYTIHGDNATVCLGLRKIDLEEGRAGACMFMQIDYKSSIHWDKDVGCVYQRK